MKSAVGVLTRDDAKIYGSKVKAIVISQAFEDFHGITRNITSSNESKIL